MKAKEFSSDISIEDSLNKWFEENQEIKIIDIKYAADETSSNVLIIYQEGEKDGR